MNDDSAINIVLVTIITIVIIIIINAGIVCARWHVSQPVTFNVRADIARRSLPQLKWLMEMTPSSTITIFSHTPASSHPSPVLPLLDLAYVRRRVPQHAVFYDLPWSDHLEFSSAKDAAVTDSHNRDVVQVDEDESFNADQWKVCLSVVTVAFFIEAAIALFFIF